MTKETKIKQLLKPISLVILLLMHLLFVILDYLFTPVILHILNQQETKNTLPEKRILLTGIWVSSLLQSSSKTLFVLISHLQILNFNHRGIYHFILGMNIGTCFTTLFFALLLNNEMALAIAFAHLLFNVITALIFSFVPLLKEFPIMASKQLACLSYIEQEEQEVNSKYPRYKGLQL